MPINGTETSEIAAAVAVIAAAGLALGPSTKAAIDALKPARLVPDGYGGAAALLLGMLVGLVVGLLAAIRAGEWVWLLIGALGGLFAGANAIQIDHAATGVAAKRAEGAAEAHPGGANDAQGLDV